ncbi:ABC-three component system middle component 8 [Photorhabdus africana]|uniref:ABC-three component system middle component 8 n=1 Tax=Photorhabdus africana TaxID=3097554 RepID=UPI002B41148B|nr:ABC-three component system middle component 8 [Photorhabdus sp. CRI-LC]
MLRPTKHSHPDRTVINVALIIISRLKGLRIENYSDLLSYTKKAVSGGDVLFLPALNFLFIMGIIEYRSKTDAIEYVANNNETI